MLDEGIRRYRNSFNVNRVFASIVAACSEWVRIPSASFYSPEAELDFYSKSDVACGTGSGSPTSIPNADRDAGH
jgi:hypothetical protein